MSKLVCKKVEHEEAQLVMVCLDPLCKQQSRFICDGLCLMEQHVTEHKKQIVFIKDVVRKENLYQVMNSRDQLQKIYNFSSQFSSQTSPLLNQINLLFENLKSTIMDQLNQLQTEFQEEIQRNQDITSPMVLDLFKQVNKFFQLDELKNILKEFTENQIDLSETNFLIKQFSDSMTEEAKIKQIISQYTELKQKNKFIKFESKTFLKYHTDMIQILSDLRHSLSNQNFDDCRDQEFWKKINLKNSRLFKNNEPGSIIKFLPNSYNEKVDEIQTVNNRYIMNSRKSGLWRCMFSEQIDQKDQVVFKIKVSGDLKKLMFNISNWEERNNYFYNNTSGNLLYSKSSSNGYATYRPFDQISSLSFNESLTQANESLEYYIYINVEMDVFIILDEQKNLYYRSNFKFENHPKWFFGISSASNQNITCFEILCGKKLK